jgi:hypothetical protein
MTERTVEWIDAGREPQCPADPRFPDGMVVDLRGDQITPHCRLKLTYPALRIGHWRISCTCGYSAIVTAAGRRDDPRAVLIPCKAPAYG